MTVKELIELLKEVNPDYEIYSEGCDCSGKAGSIDIDKDSKTVEIKRE